MKFNQLNPYVRFAGQLFYKSEKSLVNVFDSRIFCVISGNAQLEISGKTYILSASDLFFCAGGSCYSISAENGCELYVLNFDLGQSRNNVTEFLPPYKISDEPKYFAELTVSDCDYLNSHIYIKNGDSFQHRIKNIIDEFTDKQPFYSEKCASLLKSVLVDIYRYTTKDTVRSMVLDDLICFIHNNLDKKLTNSQLAKLAGYHEYHLNRIFNKHFNKTIHQYIIDIRLSEAKQLLMISDLSVYEISERTGFFNTSHFCTCFYSHMNCTPSEYRAKIKSSI